MLGASLLVAVTVFYAGYNLLIKVSGSHVPEEATATILATICLQVAALCTSISFAGFLLLRGQQVLQLSSGAYFWAAAAGVCIGGAEIVYFYLFGGIGDMKPMSASVAIPAIVSGTIVITMLAALFVFGERLGWAQLIGCACILAGIGILFLGGRTSGA